MGFITANRKQQHVFGYSLDDFVEGDSKCRYILQIIDRLDLSELYSNYSKQGAESYDPKILLLIWFLAYCEGITFSRKIENLCKKHMDFIFISGNLRPDHSTLCRFIQRNSELWPKYFYQILEIAKREKISEFKSIMIDGTKILAKSSKKQSMREKKIDKYLKAIKEDIKKYKEEIDTIENKERKEEQEKKIEQLEKKEKLLKKRKTELQKRKETLKPKDRENHQINLIEKDAFMMDLGCGKGYAPAYNGQIAVDAESQFIVACDLVQDRNDEKQFSEMHKKTENNLGEEKERLYGADAGYNSMEQVEYVEEKNIDAYIADPKLKHYQEETFEELKDSGRKLNRLDFRYNEQEDNYLCPAGNKLVFMSEENNPTRKGRNYICKNCSGCEIKHQCLSKEKKRQVKILFRDYREVYAETMRNKIKTEEAQKIFLKRQSSVEPVFGNIKENLGFRRFRVKGLKNVKSEFALMCIAHNLNKLFKLILCTKFLQFKAKLYFILGEPRYRFMYIYFHIKNNGTIGFPSRFVQSVIFLCNSLRGGFHPSGMMNINPFRD